MTDELNIIIEEMVTFSYETFVTGKANRSWSFFLRFVGIANVSVLLSWCTNDDFV